LALSKKGESVRTFSGAVEGFIAPSESGKGGFGYDSLFIPEGSCRTFAEFTPEQKHSCSHRGRALRQAVTYLRSVS
jgi:XTP/dITP diphosphohydrolase